MGRGFRGAWTQGKVTPKHMMGPTVTREAQVVQTLGVLEGACLTQGRHELVVVSLRGHASPQLRQQQGLCVVGGQVVTEWKEGCPKPVPNPRLGSHLWGTRFWLSSPRGSCCC